MTTIVQHPGHVAFHFLGCARQTDDGVAVPSLEAPMIEALAEAFERLTVVAYDPPAVPRDSGEDADFTITAKHKNLDLFSLGPMGSWREALGRARAAAPRVAAASNDWDLLIVWLPNRRAGVVTNASKTSRLLVIDGSCVTDEIRTQPVAFHKKVVRSAIAAVTDRIGRRLIDDAGLVIVNSEMLASRHRELNDNVTVQRWTRRRSDVSFAVDDRFTTAPPRLLFAGRLSPYKGIFETLEAFAKLRSDPIFANATLDVAGDGPSMADVRTKIYELGLRDHVAVRGWLPGDELFELYRNADLLFHPSYAESFPRVVLEALAHSVPVICTAVGGLRDILADEREVLFVEAGEVEPIVAAAKRIASDGELRRRLIANGFEAAKESALDEFIPRAVNDIMTTWPELAKESAQ